MFNLPLKRQRDDGLLLDENPIHEKKKRRPPFLLRTSQDPGRSSLFHENSQTSFQFRPPALTPIESSDDDEDGPNNLLCNNPMNTMMESPHGYQLPVCSEMSIDSRKKTPSLPGGDNLSPWPVTTCSNGSVQPSPIPQGLVNQSLNITTPTCDTFTPGLQPESTMEPKSAQQTDPMLSNDSDADKNHDTAWWYRRRLPSPISEDESSFTKSTKASFDDAEMAYSSPQPVSPPSYELHRVSAPTPLNRSPSMVYPERMRQQNHRSGSPPTKKVSFSMGYRADCDKCRNKIPGHYSHIIRG